MFDSKSEYGRWGELKLLVLAGEIENLRRQVRYELIPKMGKRRAVYYVADFVYARGGKVVVEDEKGFKNRVYMLKRKLMFYRHGIEILET